MALDKNVTIAFYKKLSPVESLAHLENELIRYQEQKQALQNTAYPKDQEQSKQLLLSFYTEQINNFKRGINAQKKVGKTNEYCKHCETRQRYFGNQSTRNLQ